MCLNDSNHSLASFPGARGVARKERLVHTVRACADYSVYLTNPDMNAPRALNCAHQCFVSTHVSLYSHSASV